MLINIFYGLSTMAVCLLLQSLPLVLVLRYYLNQEPLLNTTSLWRSLRVLIGVMTLLVIGNITQIAIWALLFQMLGEFTDFSTAYYHSAVNFATLGYGDIVMSEKHKLLGPLEAVNGVLMIGVSTAVMMSAVQHTIRKSLHPGEEEN